MDNSEYVILVTPEDVFLGTEEKIRAHELGLLHRAFSVFIYRKRADGVIEFLLQKRHPHKYHCGDLWSNACCSHPRLGEEIQAAAMRRLKEEIHLSVPLHVVGKFCYRASFANGLIEHELDYVLLGEYDEKTGKALVSFDKTEISAMAWITQEKLMQALEVHPELYTPWLKPALNIAWNALCQI